MVHCKRLLHACVPYRVGFLPAKETNARESILLWIEM